MQKKPRILVFSLIPLLLVAATGWVQQWLEDLLPCLFLSPSGPDSQINNDFIWKRGLGSQKHLTNILICRKRTFSCNIVLSTERKIYLYRWVFQILLWSGHLGHLIFEYKQLIKAKYPEISKYPRAWHGRPEVFIFLFGKWHQEFNYGETGSDLAHSLSPWLAEIPASPTHQPAPPPKEIFIWILSECLKGCEKHSTLWDYWAATLAGRGRRAEGPGLMFIAQNRWVLSRKLRRHESKGEATKEAGRGRSKEG